MTDKQETPDAIEVFGVSSDLIEDPEIIRRWDFFVQNVNSSGDFKGGGTTGHSSSIDMKDNEFFVFISGLITAYGSSSENEDYDGNDSSIDDKGRRILSPAEKLDVIASSFSIPYSLDADYAMMYKSYFMSGWKAFGTILYADILTLIHRDYLSADVPDEDEHDSRDVLMSLWAMLRDSEFGREDLQRFSAEEFLVEFPVQNALNLLSSGWDFEIREEEDYDMDTGIF